MAVTVEVLFEFKESRRQLHIPQNEICQAVRDELATLGKEDIVLELRNQSSNCSPHAYLLQKWSPRSVPSTFILAYRPLVYTDDGGGFDHTLYR